MIPRPGWLLVLLALPWAAWAWDHDGQVWAPADQPPPYEVSDTPVPGLGAGVPAQEIAAAFTAWTDHACLDLSTPVGTTATDNPGHKADGRSVFTFEDPFDQVPGGSWAITVIETSDEVVFTQEGVAYERITEADVVFADQVTWATDPAIDAGGCTDALSFRSVALRETGRFLGLGLSCDRGEDCTSEQEEATLHWRVDFCDTSRSTLAPDDLHGLAALYGPYVPFDCSPEQVVNGEERVFGMVPFEVTCAVATDHQGDVDGVTWDFGEGDPGTGVQASHTYTEMGNYDVSPCFDAPALEVCDLFEECPEREGYVVGCVLPTPVIGWDVVDGALIQLVNDTPIPAEGCFDTVQWTLYDEEGAILDVLEEWEPTYEFPGPGDYLAELELSGPAGFTSAQTFPHVEGALLDDTGTPPPIVGCRGCATGGSGAPSGWLLIALLALGCARRPAPVPAEEGKSVSLLETPFAELSIPPDSRPHAKDPPERIPLGPWTPVSGAGGEQRWEAPLPVRPRALFFYSPPDGMDVVDAEGHALEHERFAPPEEVVWGFDAETLLVSAPRSEEAVPARSLFLQWPLAKRREAALNFASAGVDDAASFVRTSIQSGPTTRTGLLLPAPGVASWDLEIPPAAELHFTPSLVEPEVRDAPPSDGATLVFEVEHDGATNRVWRKHLLPGHAFTEERVDLSAWAGQTVRLRLRSEPGRTATFDYAFVGDPFVASRVEGARRGIVIFVDTLRPDHMGLYGHDRETTPSLDAWATGAVVFDDARSVAPWTLPTARALLTGHQPELYDVSETLAERLRREGFATAMFAGNVYLSSNFGINRDWGVHRVTNKPSADSQVEQALEWLESVEGRDAFLVVHLMDIHLPYQEPLRYRHRWAGDAPKSLGTRFHRTRVLRSPMGEAEQTYIVDRYDGALRYVDDALATLLDALDEDDVVVFLSDHGEEFWEHGEFEHGHSLYDELLKVPLIVRASGVAPGRVAAPVSLIDVPPTVLGLLGVDDEDLDGVDLRPAMAGDPAALDALATRDIAFGRPLYGETRWGTLRGVEKYLTHAGDESLFLLDEDPEERIDRLRRRREDAGEYRRRLGAALGTEVRVGFRLLPNERGRWSTEDLIVTLTVPGGVATAFVGDDPTGHSEAEVLVEGDRVVAVWPRNQSQGREVFVVPERPFEEVVPGLVADLTSGRASQSYAFDASDIPRPGRSSVALMLVEEARNVRLDRAVVPLPLEGSQALQGFDPELSSMLQAMGYAVGDPEQDDSPPRDAPDDR